MICASADILLPPKSFDCTAQRPVQTAKPDDAHAGDATGQGDAAVLTLREDVLCGRSSNDVAGLEANSLTPFKTGMPNTRCQTGFAAALSAPLHFRALCQGRSYTPKPMKKDPMPVDGGWPW
jgi:hypothetical protein